MSAPDPDPAALGLAVLQQLKEQERQILILREELDRARANLRYTENALRDSERRDWAHGVWLVENAPGRSSRRHLGLLADLPDPVGYAAVARHQDAITAAITENRGRGLSAHDLAGEIVRAVAKALEAGDGT